MAEKRCAAYLLSCTWVEKTLAQQCLLNEIGEVEEVEESEENNSVLFNNISKVDSMDRIGYCNGKSTKYPANDNDNTATVTTAVATPEDFPSRVIPVFVLPTISPSPRENRGLLLSSTKEQQPQQQATFVDAKSSESNNSKTSSSAAVVTIASSGTFSGVAILCDALMGHVALFQTTAGLASAVNLTVHTKLCELQEQLQVTTVAETSIFILVYIFNSTLYCIMMLLLYMI